MVRKLDARRDKLGRAIALGCSGVPRCGCTRRVPDLLSPTTGRGALAAFSDNYSAMTLV